MRRQNPSIRAFTLGALLLLIPTVVGGALTPYRVLVSIPTDTRALGMGESALTSGTGPLVALSNPALLGLDDNLTVMGTPPVDWPFDDFTLQDYAFSIPLPSVAGRKAALALGYRRFDLEFRVRSAFEPGNGELVELTSEAWSAALGVPVLPWLSAGASVRSAEFGEDGDHLSSFDLHILALRHIEIPGNRALQTRFAVAARNLGEQRTVPVRGDGPVIFEQVGVQSGPLPTEWALGAGADLHWGPSRISATFELADPVYGGATDEWRQHYGVEGLFFAVAAVRVGFVNEENFNDFTFGAGLRIPVLNRVYLSADYARRANPFEDSDFDNLDVADFYSFGVSYDLP